MGITGLMPFLTLHDKVDIVSLRDKYRHQVIPCDIASTLFKYRTTSATDHVFMLKVRAFIASFLMAEVHVVFIFDGKAPPDKDAEHRERAEQRDRAAERLDGLAAMLADLALTDDQILHGIAELNLRIPEIEGAAAIEKFDLAARVDEFVSLGGGGDTTTSDQVGEPEETDHPVEPVALIDQVTQRLPVGSTESALRSTLRQVYEKRMTRNVKLEPQHFDMVKHYMTEHGVPWIQAPGEAEAFACYLIEHQASIFAPAILSEDSDCLTYGAPYWLSGYKTFNWTCRSVDLGKVLNELGFVTFERFRDFTLLAGCDYNDHLPGYGPTMLHKRWIKAGITLEEFLMTTATNVTGEQLAALRLERCRTLFECYGQDTVELRDQVLGGCFREWLDAQPNKLPYWVLDKEAELADMGADQAWRQEGERPENVRVHQNWRYPEGIVSRSDH